MDFLVGSQHVAEYPLKLAAETKVPDWMKKKNNHFNFVSAENSLCNVNTNETFIASENS